MMNEFTRGPLTLIEMMKIVSLLENPPEATMVRKALRFYDIPESLKVTDYKWGANSGLMDVLYHYAFPQNPSEVSWMLQFIKGKNSLLEIGSSFGGTLQHMASVLNRGCRIVSVDLPLDDTPKFLNPVASLKESCRQIGTLGGNVELILGNSHEPQVIEKVKHYAPFDFGFIDGDHSYQGVRQDFENYAPLCKIVGLHDIAGPVEGCTRFWNELKASGKHRFNEFVGDAERKFGIGIVFMEESPSPL